MEAPAHPRDGCVLLEYMHGNGTTIEERHCHRHLHCANQCSRACCAFRHSYTMEGGILHEICFERTMSHMDAIQVYPEGERGVKCGHSMAQIKAPGG